LYCSDTNAIGNTAPILLLTASIVLDVSENWEWVRSPNDCVAEDWIGDGNVIVTTNGGYILTYSNVSSMGYAVLMSDKIAKSGDFYSQIGTNDWILWGAADETSNTVLVTTNRLDLNDYPRNPNPTAEVSCAYNGPEHSEPCPYEVVTTNYNCYSYNWTFTNTYTYREYCVTNEPCEYVWTNFTTNVVYAYINECDPHEADYYMWNWYNIYHPGEENPYSNYPMWNLSTNQWNEASACETLTNFVGTCTDCVECVVAHTDIEYTSLFPSCLPSLCTNIAYSGFNKVSWSATANGTNREANVSVLDGISIIKWNGTNGFRWK
jgi:hypothetical protein